MYSGGVPFAGMREAKIVRDVLTGIRPLRPTNANLDDHVWLIITRCWSADASARPQAADLLELALGEAEG
jgi:hypothetical protein